MKLDASKEFEAMTGYANNIKMQASLIGDTQVLLDLTFCLGQIIRATFLELDKEESASKRTLLVQEFQKQLDACNLTMIAHEKKEVIE